MLNGSAAQTVSHVLKCDDGILVIRNCQYFRLECAFRKWKAKRRLRHEANSKCRRFLKNAWRWRACIPPQYPFCIMKDWEISVVCDVFVVAVGDARQESLENFFKG